MSHAETSDRPFDAPPEVPVHHLRSHWRVAAWRRLALLADRTTRPPADPNDVRPTGAEGDLQLAATGFNRPSLSSWWTGRSEEQVHAGLDRAERALVPTSEAALEAYVPGLKARIRRRFRSGDNRRTEALKLLEGSPKRPWVLAALELLQAGSVDLRWNQRVQRNRTIVATILFGAALVALAVVFDSDVGGLTLAKPGSTVVPNPWVVALGGAIGGLISVLPMLRRAGRPARASAAWTAQMLFKVVTGALFALVAAWLIQTGVLKIVDPQEAGVLTAWAVVFGYSQDVITKRLDERLATTTPPPQPAANAAEADDD